MLYFDNCGVYIESKTSIKARITAIDAVIVAMESSLLKAASGQDVSEYQLNDSQTIIKVVNRGVDGITKSMNALIALKNYYMNNYSGRVFRAMDSKNFPNYGGY